MRAPVTVSLYLAREVSLYTLIGFLTAFPVVLVPNFMQRMHQFALPGIVAEDMVRIAAAIVPLVTAYALPVSFLFGVMIALGRLSSDSELLAMHSSGLGIGALASALLIVGGAVSAASAFLVIVVEARAQKALTRVSLEIAARGAVIETGRFQRFDGRMIFAQERVRPGRLERVMISDWSAGEDPYYVFAEAAEILFDREQGVLHLMLENGEIRSDTGPGSGFEEYRMSFSRFDYSFDASGLLMEHWRYWPSQLDMDELRDAAARIDAGAPIEDLWFDRSSVYRTQIQRRYAVPLAPILFALVGIALGDRGSVRGRARGLLLAGGVLVVYYSLFSFGQSVAHRGLVAPSLAIWMPNLLLAATGVGLLRRSH